MKEIIIAGKTYPSRDGWYIHNWFSNMLPFERPFELAPGAISKYPESLYMSMRYKDLKVFYNVAQMEAKKAKKYSRENTPDVMDKRHRINLMQEVQRLRVDHDSGFKKNLIGSGNQEIIEWTNWGGLFWGVDAETGMGENQLGIILMKLRREITR